MNKLAVQLVLIDICDFFVPKKECTGNVMQWIQNSTFAISLLPTQKVNSIKVVPFDYGVDRPWHEWMKAKPTTSRNICDSSVSKTRACPLHEKTPPLGIWSLHLAVGSQQAFLQTMYWLASLHQKLSMFGTVNGRADYRTMVVCSSCTKTVWWQSGEAGKLWYTAG